MSKTEVKYRLLDLNKRKEILEIIKFNEKNGIKTNCSAIARKYCVSESTIRRIKSFRKFYEKHLKESKEMSINKTKKKIISSKNSLLEEALYEWFKQKMAIGQTPSREILKKQALLINSKIKGDPAFKASDGWFARFRVRFQIGPRSLQGDKPLPECESEKEFVDKLNSRIKLSNFQLHQIYNADEMGLRWKMLPMTPFITEFEESASGFKLSKDRVTAMMCSNADGSHKVPLFVIGKSNNPKSSKCFEDVNRLPVTYNSQKDALMSRELFKKWYTEVFLPSVREFQAETRRYYKVLLILDNADCHFSKEELDSIDNLCSVEVVPTSAISFQPMIQGIVEEMKKLYRKSFLREMLLEDNKQNLLKLLKEVNIKTCCIQMACAWSQITDLHICRAWRKLIPTCKINTACTTVTVDDIKQILHRLPGFQDITKEEVSKWLQVDSYETGWSLIDIEEIVHSTQGITAEVEEESTDNLDLEVIVKEETDPLELKVEANVAYKGLQEFRNWFQRQWECDPEHMVMLQQINDISKEILSRLNY